MNERLLKEVLSTILQIGHLVVAAALLMLGFAIFLFSAPLFDLLGPGDRSILPGGVFQVQRSIADYLSSVHMLYVQCANLPHLHRMLPARIPESA